MRSKLIIGLSAILLAVVLVTVTTIFVLKAREIGDVRSQWPTTQAIVQSSSVSGIEVKTTDTHLTVEFSYEVDNIRYSGLEKWYIRWSDTKAAVDEYPPGASIEVYYNPSDHSNAVIYPTNVFIKPWLADLMGYAGIAVIFLVYYGVYMLVKLRKKEY